MERMLFLNVVKHIVPFPIHKILYDFDVYVGKEKILYKIKNTAISMSMYNSSIFNLHSPCLHLSLDLHLMNRRQLVLLLACVQLEQV